MAQSALSKVGRVKVGVRCRPAFQDEIDFAKGEFISIVDTRSEAIGDPSLGQLSLTLISGKQREFLYDYVFGTEATQDQVYKRIAQPVVADVLKGFNGTIFAYGQTGTGKTYTMGILEFISNEHAGIIPRAVAQIFHHVEHQRVHSPGNEITISLSFLQLYRETIQDLLAPANGNASSADDNLLIREDPQRGFYVEGLQEFVVRNYEESEALINLGLENRAIAPTLMNATSSRSHTVLTLNIEQRITTDVQANTSASNNNTAPSTPGSVRSTSTSTSTTSLSVSRKSAQYTKTLRSKLLMVDLAGSERVRRTVSKGARLSEAKSINTSLSALGNVIAALAESNVSHIPYRDSKLTRLLQDSLGGTARTALIATVGPAAINYGETLSTLLFATRCMSVKTVPIQHAEVDYAEMCAALQAKVNEMEGVTTQRLLQQQEGYEETIRELRNQLELERSNAAQHQIAIAQHSRDAAKAAFSTELRTLLEQVEKVRRGERVKVTARGRGNSTNGSGINGNVEGSIVDGEVQQGIECWLNKPVGYSLIKSTTTTVTSTTSTTTAALKAVPVDAQQAQLLAYCFEVIAQLSAELHNTLKRNSDREELTKANLSDEFSAQEAREAQRQREKAAMDAEDPRNKAHSAHKRNNNQNNQPSEHSDSNLKIGSHLAPMSQLDALRRVEGQYRSNNDPVTHISTNSTHNSMNDANSFGNSTDNALAQSLLLHQLAQPLNAPVEVPVKASLFNYATVEDLATALTNMHQGIRENLASIKTLLARKDAHFQNVKEALTLQLVEKRKREEEVINWSYILKYLLGSASKLRRQVNDEKTHTTTTTLLHHSNHHSTNLTTNNNVNNSVLELPIALPASLASVVPVQSERITNHIVQNNNQNSDRIQDNRDTLRDRNIQNIVDEGSYYDSQPGRVNHTVANNVGNNVIASIVPPGRPRSSSRNRERGDSLGNSLNTSVNNHNNGQIQELPQQQQQQMRPAMRQPSPQPLRGNTTSTPNFGTTKPSAHNNSSLGAGLQAQYQHQPAPISPPYSSVDDSDLSVGSTVHSHNTHHSLHNHSQPYGHNGAEMSTFRSSVPTFQPAANNHQGYQSYTNNYPLPQAQPMLQQHQQQQPSFYNAPPGQGYREPPSSTRSTRSHNSTSGTSLNSSTSQRAAHSREDNDYTLSTPMPSVPRQRAPSPAPHSQFAQEVIQDLGVDSSQASAAMSVIDKVTMITEEQLAQLDTATRNQILQIRRELGIASAGASGGTGGSYSNNNIGGSGAMRRATPGPASVPKRGDNHSHLPPQGVRNMQYYAPGPQSVSKRASSAPRQRSLSGGSASVLSQHSQPQQLSGAYWSHSTPSAGQSRSNSNSRGRASPYLDPAMNRSSVEGYSDHNFSMHTPQQLSGVYSPYTTPSAAYPTGHRNSSNSANNRRFDAFSPPQQHQQQYQQQYYEDDDDDNFSQLDML